MDGQRFFNKFLDNPALLFLLPSLGVVSGYFLLTYGTQESELSFQFIALPEFQLWRIFIIMHFAYMFGVLGFLYMRTSRVIKERLVAGHWPAIILALLIPIALFWGPNKFGPEVLFPLDMHDARMIVLLTFTALVALLSILSMLVLFYDFKQLANDANAQSLETRIEHYLQRKQDVRWFLVVLGFLLTLGILDTGALSKAMLTLNDKYFVTREIVIAYGGYFTLLLAIVYMPLYIVEQTAGKTLSEKLLVTSTDKKLHFIEAEEARGKIKQHLQIGLTARQNLESTIPILSPILAAIVSGLLGKG